MNCVLLAGGLGTRLGEETQRIPKPMIEIGGIPIIAHIMKYYAFYGINNFIICAGYKQEIIRDYFYNYYLYNSDIEIDLSTENTQFLTSKKDKFKVTIIDTGLNTPTGERLQRIKKYVENESFYLTYSDGVSNINLHSLLAFHKTHNKCITLTAVNPVSKYGTITIEDETFEITEFKEKVAEDNTWINGGFMVVNPSIFSFLKNEDFATTLERLSKQKELMAYKHKGFWMCMDSMHDKEILEKLWNSNKAEWKVW